MKKLKRLVFDYRMRIISVIFIFAVLTTCVIAYLRTYSEYVSNPNNLNGVIGNTIYINDADEDWYYYMGQNYTYSSDGTLPTFADKGIYDDTNLVETQITYSGTDVIYEDTGYTSLNERQSNYVYYKYYPVYDNGTESTSDDYILIELIDNPYTDRPDDLGFNGWITSYQGVTTSYDSVYYERYAKVPVTYASGKPSKITITFNASWTIASVGTMTNSWNNAFSGLKDAGMATITVSQRVYDYNYDMSDYYTQTTIARYEYYEGYYDYYGTLYTSGSGYCTSLRGCTVYEKMTGQIYNSNTTYYEVSSGYMQVLNHSTIPFSYSDEWAEPFESTTNMAGFYRAETISYNSSLIGYYDSNGNALSGTCGSTTCTYYKLIQYYNSNNDLELAEMNKTYYYLVTRDTNIIYMTSNVSGSWDNYTKPFTLTSLHNGTKANITWTTSSAAVNCYADTRIENLTINDGRGYAYNTSPTNYTGRIKYIYGNYYNLKIGRGIAQSGSNGTAVAVIGGDNNATGNSTIGSASNPKKYKLIIESGFYSSLAMTNGASGNTSYHNTIYVAAKAIYGNDYDRIINNNDGLIVYYCASGSWRGQYRSTSNTTVMFDLILKSGQYGSGKYDDTAGIYVGGRMGGTHYAAKRAKIEGGVIYSLIGGPLTASSQADYNDTYIAVTGGTIDMIIGGAGQTATYGNRLVQVTGGTINYSVFGGSNGSNGSSGDGTVNGDSFIYIGGVAIVGDSTLVLNNSTLHGAEAGSIFGIGNGNSSNSTIGSSDNSYVVIADSAIVRRSVYGGGNYGATGVSSSSNITTTEIKIIGGSINDSVYGGGNNNGSGSSSKTSTINIEMTGGTVSGSVYGGSNIDGTVYGSSTVNIYGGTVSGSVYGGGKGGNTYSSGTDGTYVSGTTSVTVGHASITTYTGPTVSGSIYGGSAYGTVGGTASNNTYTNNDTSVTVNRGTITGSVFGGGQGSSTYTPYVKGDVVVDINGGTIGNVYGGCDLAGSPSGTVQVYIDGGTVSDCVYGGGNQAGVDSTYVYLRGGTVSGSAYGGSNAAGATTTRVYLQGSTVTDIYGGSNASGIVTTSNVTTSSGTVGTIYGGNKSGGSTTTTNITTNGGNITTIYGGGKGVTGGNGTAASAGITHVTLNSAANTITAVYGGGESSNAIETHVTLAGASVTTIYGGSDITGTVGESNVSVSSGTAGTIYGGNNAGGTTTNTNVITTGGTITNVYGGGKGVVGGTGTEAYSSTTNVSLTSTAILGSVYGGGSLANVTGTTSVGISSSNVAGNVYGGGDEASVGSNVTLSTSGSTINGTIYGGGNQAAVAGTITSIISNTNVGANVYGGGDEGASNSSVSLTINNNSDITGSVYGGGNQAGVTGIITTSITGSTIDVDVYGGGNAGAAGSDTSLTINTSTISGSTYGGGYGVSATVAGDALIGLTSTNVVGNVYGGGNAGTIGETVTLTTTDSTVGGSIYGGGNQAAVTGVITSTISNTDVGTNVYGGGNAGASNSNVSLTINNGSDITGSVYGGGYGVSATVAGSTDVDIIATNVTENIYGGGNAGVVSTGTNLFVSSGTITGSIYGGGNQAAVNGTVVTTISGTTVGGNIYGGGNEGAVNASVSLTINTSSSISGSVYGGGDAAVVTGTATTNISNTTIDVDIYGGGNAANVNGAILTTVAGDIVGGSIYGGGNEGASNSTVALNVATSTNVTGSVYGGGNQAAVIGSATTNILNSTVGVDVYGGGNAGAVGGNVTLNINNATISGSAYGGGYGVSAAVAGSVDFDLLSSNVTIDVFGGGNAGTVAGSTDLYVSSDIIGGNVYGGGNGATAIVTVNNLLNIDGTTIISGSAYGGGNAAATGNQLNNNSSIGIINVAGAQIAGDVYGGAKTSKLYGTAYTNIGINAVSTTGLISDDISITGTVYGGGDAKPAGSDEYTFNFLSVTNGTVVTIDGLNHTNFSIDGSLFGSGNNSSVDGGATLYIKNYGTLNNCKYNISIQRATVAVIDNSCIEIEGAADRTQELKDTPYTFSLIDDLTIKNNTTLYLQTITNKLASFTSAVDVNGSEVLSAVDIDSNTGEVTRNTNNRLYIWAGENVNISPDAFVDTVTGPVFGMTFFGRYDHDRDNNIYSAYYDNSVEAGDTATTGELNYFSEGSYVKGLHKRLPNYTEQDITVDGFYTNQEDKDNPGVIETIYVEPELVGQNQEHYIWTIGEGVTKLTVDLTASKYSTLGGQALTLDSFYKANTTFTILGFYYNDFDSNASLINSSTIPRIASTSTIADNNMGLVMMTGTNGWLNSGTTEYFTNNSNPYTGTTYYESDNSAIAPTLYFYLYHSKNLGSDADMGTVTISLLVVTPDNLIESIVQRVNIEVSISRVLITENYYDAAITSGQQYEMFVTTPTSINAKSSFSTYYSLYSESTSTIYQNGYYRALTSNYALPENTRITMIDYYDMSNPEYYYYVVTASDEAAALTEISQQGEASYNLSSFIQMGSINTGSSTTTYHYDDATKNALYYDSNTGVAMEEFIFIIDLSETNIATNHSNLSLLIDLRRVFNGSVVSVMGVNNEIARLIVYNLYANSGATINVASSLTPSTVYLGDNSTLNVTTDFVLATVGGTTVQDTRYYDQKLGLKITFFNENGDQINGYDLMGVALQYNGIDHYPRIDGSYRINIANRVANASSNITVRSINSNLSSGVYTINVEAFGSPDGIYYGDISPSSATPIDLTVINSLYGLKVSLASNSKIINKTTGLTLNDNNVLVFYFNYSSGLSSPQIRMHLERRDYTNIYSTMYNDVNLQDYVTNNLIPVGNAEDYQYLLVNNPGATFNMMLYLDTDLVSGTYKFVFSLYENGSYIGDVEEYVVIK